MAHITPPKISAIKKMPTTWDKPPRKMHESISKAHATLMLIMKMVNRGDSQETIWNVYDEIYNGVEVVQATVTFGTETFTETGSDQPEDKN